VAAIDRLVEVVNRCRLRMSLSIWRVTMSWDVLLVNGVPSEVLGLSPRDPEAPPPTELGLPTCALGEKADILLMLKRLFPHIDVSDPTWGVLIEHALLIEFNMGADDPIPEMMLHVRGNGDPITIIKRLCDQTGWRALDCSDLTFIDFSTHPAARFDRWRAWRDQAGWARHGPATERLTEAPVQLALPFASEEESS
jgi:hypothetical protein